MSEQVDFGYKKVLESEKSSLVGDVFKRVSGNYDLMNDVMSGGLHRLWKRSFVRSLPLKGGAHYLDVAGGTGDIAKAIWGRLSERGLSSTITVSDINPHMMREGQKRCAGLDLTWSCGDAEALPFPDASVDVYTIAFGLRNVTHIDKALAEAVRVLRPGGVFACLEFSEVAAPLKPFYDLYSFKILPLMGEVIAKDRDAYQYLAESIRTFPNQESLKTMMKEAGFERTSYTNYTGGIVAVHKGYKKSSK